MRTTMDKAGRLVIPKALRDRLGLRPGPVEVLADASGLLVIPPSGARIGDDDVRDWREADQW